MSSGEADVIHFTVKDSVTTTTNTWDGTTTTYWTYPYWGSETVYLYQITCPKCQTLNWAKVDTVIVCKGTTQARNNRVVACGAKLKAVLDTVDYEVPVVQP